MSPNLVAALNIMRVNQDDMSLSTQDPQAGGQAVPNVTATASLKAEQNAKVILGVFATMIADLVRQIGYLTMDCIIMHTTVGEIDATVPDNLKMKFRTLMMKGKEGGKEVTNKITFSSDMMGKKMTKEKANKLEWDMFFKNGGMQATQMEYVVNPYKFARFNYSLFIDPDQIISRSMGTDQMRKDRAFNLLMDPRVAPFVNQKAVVDKFVIDEYSDGDPDEFKKPDNQQTPGTSNSGGQNNELLQNIMQNPNLGIQAGANARQ